MLVTLRVFGVERAEKSSELLRTYSLKFCDFWFRFATAKTSKFENKILFRIENPNFEIKFLATKNVWAWALIYEWTIDFISFVWLSVHGFQGFFPFSTATSNRSIFFVIGSWASGKNVRRALGSLSGLSYFWSPNTTAKPSKIELYRSSIFSISRCWNMVRSKIAKCDRFRLSVRYYTFPLH